MRELDLIVLTRDLPRHGLKTGDVGAVVHCYSDQHAYEIEFVTAEGKPLAVLTLTESEIRPFSQKEILHSREIPPLPD